MNGEWRRSPSAATRSDLAVAVVSPVTGFADVVGGLLDDEALQATVERVDATRVRDAPAMTAHVVVLGPGARMDAYEVRRLHRELQEATAILVVLPVERRMDMRGLLEAGAAGIVPEPAVADILALAVRSVVAGLMVVPEEHRHAMSPPSLSHRERQVLGLVTAGLTNEEIAHRLFLAESTVKGYLTSVFQRLGVHSRREAASLVLRADESLRRGLTAPPPPDESGGPSQNSRSMASAT
jgi:DNA-binding NarL/FixJ family response regulator